MVLGYWTSQASILQRWGSKILLGGDGKTPKLQFMKNNSCVVDLFPSSCWGMYWTSQPSILQRCGIQDSVVGGWPPKVQFMKSNPCVINLFPSSCWGMYWTSQLSHFKGGKQRFCSGGERYKDFTPLRQRKFSIKNHFLSFFLLWFWTPLLSTLQRREVKIRSPFVKYYFSPVVLGITASHLCMHACPQDRSETAAQMYRQHQVLKAISRLCLGMFQKNFLRN